jgi:predicted transcriptional regulator of viral defense system
MLNMRQYSAYSYIFGERMNVVQTILEIAQGSNGFISASQATSAGIPRRCLSELVAAGKLVQVERGLYSLPDAWEDEFVIAQHRFARGVFSHESALFLHDLTDRTPPFLTMTFPRSYNASRVRKAGIIARTCAESVLGLGLIQISTPSGNMVKAYDRERTLCDAVRGQLVVDVQIVNPAMKTYATMRGKDIGKLLAYARELGVERKIRNYMEILL